MPAPRMMPTPPSVVSKRPRFRFSVRLSAWLKTLALYWDAEGGSGNDLARDAPGARVAPSGCERADGQGDRETEQCHDASGNAI